MATIDITHQRGLVLSSPLIAELPEGILNVIRDSKSHQFLDAITAAAAIPKFANHLFVLFEHSFADICARWTIPQTTNSTFSPSKPQDATIISAFARILPFAPHLSVFLERYLASENTSQTITIRALNIHQDADVPPVDHLLVLLLAAWRLVTFDHRTYYHVVSSSTLQALFAHPSVAVRFVSIRIFCQLLAASDAKLEALVQKHCDNDDESMTADYDGQMLHYRFLSIYEQRRAQEITTLRKSRDELDSTSNGASQSYPPQSLTPYIVRYGNAMLPRPLGPVKAAPSSLVMTPTTVQNIEGLAKLLQNPGPILLHGLPGAGKTSFIHEIARELRTESDMVTLHLNEQTDAKMLIGLYTTDTKPGSFVWRPGVLTTAVKEGRWVLIEDLDRAPNEVMSTLLPLVERGELLIPSRSETIRAPSSFRLFATVRTTRTMAGHESVPSLLGLRFWQQLSVQMAPLDELRDIILGSYPLLKLYIPEIFRVYTKICVLARSIPVSKGVLERQMNPRDLLKWCRRRSQALHAAGCRTGEESITTTTLDWAFKEAVDCFVGSVSNEELRILLISTIAKEMHRAPESVEQFLAADIPVLEETDRRMAVGRTMLQKAPKIRRTVKASSSKTPFAATTHTKRLLEQIAVAVKFSEPLLLVGETGIGKTTVVQQLAESLGRKLVAVNLSQQSEAGDLLGGFKPVNVRTFAVPLKEEFEDLFAATKITASSNQKYLAGLAKLVAKGEWVKVTKLWRQPLQQLPELIAQRQEKARNVSPDPVESKEQPTKKRKADSRLQSLLEILPRWEAFGQKLDQFDVQLSRGSGGFAFSFVEGKIVKAVRNGDWVLLDEINLASADTLESIVDLLQSGPNASPSLLLSETGEIERIQAHPDFRIFGAMNPATDIGKRDLPIGIRSRFTELYVTSPDKDLKDLLDIVKKYLKRTNIKDDKAADDIARLYLDTKKLAAEKQLVDGANEVPHFSLRTLTRVLTYVSDIAPFYGLRRALYEGFSMGFLTLLDKKSEELLMPIIHKHLFNSFGGAKKFLSAPAKHPQDGQEYVKFVNESQDKKGKERQYWLVKGQETAVERPDYIITPSVERNLLNLVRATSTRRFPILIQGPTSSGKTSMIEYLAHFSGNKFVRINNHEHTDLQEYLGTYMSDSDGKLKFQEGLLVQAMREGSWIVLDELNLAPTDVLEALNRLLDDNRELLIPETQEAVKPHSNFMLFATQNPPGLYGGRKVLSRAFRNRFLELHYDDIPEDELEFILQKRAKYTSPSDCKRIVSVYKGLYRLRQASRLFERKDNFATLRDLFRWALRQADSREEIASNGFMLLAERVRDAEERDAIRGVIEKEFKVTINPNNLYDASQSAALKQVASRPNVQGVVWTHAMRRLYVLLSSALRNNEPVLLVGDTGCGKTTVCQVLAEVVNNRLHIVNAHQNTETGDLIGSQRPVRNRGAIEDALRQDLELVFSGLGEVTTGLVDDMLVRFHSLDVEAASRIPDDLKNRILVNERRSKALFEWCDGSLVHAMKEGQFFLLDEISLADDSVLERLNSVLEPHRSLLLAEKGIDNSFVKAADGFQFFATMNPGGDFGKKELSPALRNRFTEIWVPPMTDPQDVLDIVKAKLKPAFHQAADKIVDFSYWFGGEFRSTSSTAFSIRDILTWVRFINDSNSVSVSARVLNGAATVFIDTLGANPSALMTLDAETMDMQRQKCLTKLSERFGEDFTTLYRAQPEFVVDGSSIVIGDFRLPRNPQATQDVGFSFQAPTTRLNAMRVARALQIEKPILLEGNPGVGKTTLISALAQACGRPLTRINLSDQTDLMDLFGTDVPVEGAEAGNFAWRDAPFLQAMQKGEWVLLDEMNLASQSVLEGLNACLDHRGEVYVSELDQVFKRHPDFRLFAAQNPHHQGGGRKGLPSSFVNRFVVVYCEVFTDEDLYLIAAHNYPAFSAASVKTLINFVSELEHKINVEKVFGVQGGPWEFNLRDILRWVKLSTSEAFLPSPHRLHELLDMVIRQRFRTTKDREAVTSLFCDAVYKYGDNEGGVHVEHNMYHSTTPNLAQVGMALAHRNEISQPTPFPRINSVQRLAEIESVLIAVKENIPCVLTGTSGCGKTVLLQHVAALTGKELVVFPLNADVDTMDLVGGFEQADPLREVNGALHVVKETLRASILEQTPEVVPQEVLDFGTFIDSYDGEHGKLGQILAQTKLVKGRVALDSTLYQKLASLDQALNQPFTLRNPTFEWLDGIIVKALEKGQWLVLDNANLCSASVLDRLNSLLEPNGLLSINEHCGPGGEPRVIRPHPNFRIFLTMDPRYGELSRAMRNRAIEIHMEMLPLSRPQHVTRMAPVESSLESIHHAELIGAHDENLRRLGLDSLAMADLPLLKYCGGGNIGSFAQLFGEMDEGRACLSTLYSQLPGSLPGFQQYQPMHPLLNEVALPLFQLNSKDYPFRAAVYLEGLERVLNLTEELGQASVATHGLVSQRTRLQRSAMDLKKNSSVARDSTAKVSPFLKAVLVAVKAIVGLCLDGGLEWTVYQDAIQHVLLYWTRTLREVSETHPRFNEARFQAHLAQGRNLVNKFCSQLPSEDSLRTKMEALLEMLDSRFEEGFKLSSGRSMEALWLEFQPSPIKTADALKQSTKLEMLASRFDALKWKAQSSTSDLAGIVSKLSEAYYTVRCQDADATALIAEFTTEIQALESRVANETAERAPVLSAEFNSLRQMIALQSLADGKTKSPISHFQDVIVLSNTPSISQMALQSSPAKAVRLQTLDFIIGQQPETLPWKGNFSHPLLAKLARSSSSSLSSLKSFEAELPLLAKSITSNTRAITTSHIAKLNKTAQRLLVDLLSALDPSLSQIIRDDRSQLFSLSHSDPHVRDLLLPALASAFEGEASPEDITHSVNAWAGLATALLGLYVPDKIIDPQLRPLVEREYLEEFQRGAEGARRLGDFQMLLTGQSDSVRRRILEDMLDRNKSDPSAYQDMVLCHRPEESELGRLQAEFSGICNSIIKTRLKDVLNLFGSEGWDGAKDQLDVVRENVSRIIDRLTSRYKAYQDMTVPAVNILRCLQIVISLTELRDASKDATEGGDAFGMCYLLPTMGGKLIPRSGLSGLLVQKWVEGQETDMLAFVEVMVAIEGMDNLSQEQRQSIDMIFSAIYYHWQQKLEADRKAEESKKSLYRFKGSLEDEEEIDEQEFDSLFPTYDDGRSRPVSTRDITVRVAELHKRIFMPDRTSSEILHDLVVSVAGQVTWAPDATLDRRLFPAVLLAMDRKLKELHATSVPSDYNFYSDTNMPELRKLVELITEIQVRFRSLQLVDEIGHMQPLEDVVSACAKVLELNHDDPLAKMIGRVEYLHGFVYEWQFGGWASRQYAVLSLYNRLTDLLVSWRRLELSTWGELFDLEVKNCGEDAMSWWFLAFGAIIEEPLSLARNGGDIASHAASLLTNLEQYFSSATVGQLSTRLSMTKQLEAQLVIIVAGLPVLQPILSAVQNFIAIIGRFEEPANKAIAAGRAPLEKKMKEVVLLASWKDTNIVALRESARKSHLKLFRLVRKFRGVLGQPVRPIIEQGLPECSFSPLPTQTELTPVALDNAKSLAQCQSIAGWAENNKRLVNALKTVAIMVQAAYTGDSSLPAVNLVESFTLNLKASIKKLRGETPKTLTEENKELIPQLKIQKRRLFANTLKSVRQMGFKFNLGTDKLVSQISLSAALTRMGGVPDASFLGVEKASYHMHHILDMMPRARHAVYDHSDDLTSAEVSRSVGLLEGIMDVVLVQRSTLSEALTGLENLNKMVDYVSNLGDLDSSLDVVVPEDISHHRRFLAWGEAVLVFGGDLVRTHTKIGGRQEGNDKAVAGLNEWRDSFAKLYKEETSNPPLPSNVSPAGQSQQRREWACEGLPKFREDMRTWAAEREDMAFVFEGLAEFFSVPEERTSNGTVDLSKQVDVVALSGEISVTADRTLVTLEKLKKAGSDLPRSHEETGWLMQYNFVTESRIESLHIQEIVASVRRLFDLVGRTDAEAREFVPALMGAVAPILRQYAAICTRVLEDFSSLHATTCEFGFTLMQSFVQLSSQGFCTPQEKSDETSNESGKLEGGTGLGDGEGADDISKDIKEDEDLSELAQQGMKDDKEEIEDEKDAVDMADEELEGEMGSVVGEDEDDDKEKDSKGEEEEDAMSDEAGEVDDLDPTAVDEKMWDGDDKEAEKDQKGDQEKGKQGDEEQAADENVKKEKGGDEAMEDEQEAEEDEEGDEDGEEGQDPDDVRPQAEADRQDQNVQEEDALDLPDDMEIGGGDDKSVSGSEDEFDDLEDDEDKDGKEDQTKADAEDEEMEDAAPDGATPEEAEETDQPEESKNEQLEADGPEEADAEDEPVDDDIMEDREPNDALRTTDDSKNEQDNPAPSDEQGVGLDQSVEQTDQADNFQASAAQKRDGNVGEGDVQEESTAANDGEISRSAEAAAEDDQQQTQQQAEITQPFKKLGDALERWYKRQQDILAAPKESQDLQPEKIDDMARHEFQHLQDEDAPEDTQAMGGAKEEDVKPLDDNMAIDEEKPDGPNQVMPDEEETEHLPEPDKMDVDAPSKSKEPEKRPKEEDSRTGASMNKASTDNNPEEISDEEDELDADEEDVDETSMQLLGTHLTDTAAGDNSHFAECLQQWTAFQAKTHSLSLNLTSQLRLILTPSQATKLSGAYRTGKRLNIKRIIPYIASSYKRDKIWMRRAVPTKRVYQIIIALDDSESMKSDPSGRAGVTAACAAPSVAGGVVAGAGASIDPKSPAAMALESLVMVSRSLAMLEAGQVGVMGFGQTPFVAHALSDPPFTTPEAGARVLQRFGFEQGSTDVVGLLRGMLDLLAEARTRQGGGGERGGEDLWQLGLVISDGFAGSGGFDKCRVLMREARERRVKVVFVVVEGEKGGPSGSVNRSTGLSGTAGNSGGAQGCRGGAGKTVGNSITDLKVARMVKGEDGSITPVIERFLDGFPFEYYLIIRDLEELPGALAGVLRGWFSEVGS